MRRHEKKENLRDVLLKCEKRVFNHNTHQLKCVTMGEKQKCTRKISRLNDPFCIYFANAVLYMVVILQFAVSLVLFGLRKIANFSNEREKNKQIERTNEQTERNQIEGKKHIWKAQIHRNEF